MAMTPAQRERRARQIAAMGYEDAAQLPTAELDEVAFGFTHGTHMVSAEDVTIWDQSNWDTARAEVDADPERWARYLEQPLELDYREGKLLLRDGHHRFYTALLLGRRVVPAEIEVRDNPVVEIFRIAGQPIEFTRRNPYPEDYVVQHEVTGAHHGQVDGYVLAGDAKTGEIYGNLDYSVFGGKAHVDIIEVKPEHRSRGVARDLWARFRRETSGLPVVFGMQTEHGARLAEILERRWAREQRETNPARKRKFMR